MIEGIKNEILNLLNNNKEIKYVPTLMADDIYKDIIVLKYLCENTELTYEE